MHYIDNRCVQYEFCFSCGAEPMHCKTRRFVIPTRTTRRQTDGRRTMKTSAGCDENMNDDEEERRDWNEGVHGRVVDDERVERAEGARGGLEEADTHVEEENETPTAVRGGVGWFPFGAGGWTPPTGSDSSTPGSPGYKVLHAFADELFRAWPGLNQDSELRVALFCKFGELIDKIVQSGERAQHNLTFRQIFAALGENDAYYEELKRTP